MRAGADLNAYGSTHLRISMERKHGIKKNFVHRVNRSISNCQQSFKDKYCLLIDQACVEHGAYCEKYGALYEVKEQRIVTVTTIKHHCLYSY